MAPWVVRFVDKPDPDRKVRLDLNDEQDGGACFVDPDGFSPGTAEYLASLVESMLDDTGSKVTDRRPADREMTIPVVIRGDFPTFAAKIGALAREVDRKSNWLEFKPGEHTGESVFFELLQGDIGSPDMSPPPDEQEADGEIINRPVTLTLLCKPTAVGLEVTGTGTTGPDPAGTSTPMLALPEPKGDLPAPLTLKVGTLNTDATGPMMVAVCSGTPLLTAPVLVQAETLTSGTGASNSNDTAMSGAASPANNYTRLTFTAPNDLATLRLSGTIPAVPPGRWRIWARLRNNVAADTFQLRLDVGTATSSIPGQVRDFEPAGAANSVYWFDLGKIEHPYYAPPDSTDPADLALRLFAMRTAGAGNLDVDLLLLVPLDLRGNDLGRAVTMTPTDALGTGERWTLRPDLEMAYPSIPAKPGVIVGSHDFRAVPGEHTYIHLLRRTYPGSTALSGTNTIDWSYRPRYVYVSAPA